MNIVETLLVFLGIPLGGIAVIVAAIYGKTLAGGSNRYRPGRPWTYPAVWYLPHPAGAPALAPAGTAPPALVAGTSTPEDERMGGASGEW